MKKVRFLRNVPDKYTGERYVKGQEKEFEDARADEILNARRENGEPYAEEVTKENNIDTPKTEEIETADKRETTEKAVKNTKKKAK